MIAISLSPNTEADDVWLALRQLMTPWQWTTGLATTRLKAYFSQRFGAESVELYNSGRSALFEILKAYGIGEGDEVIVQAFTCVAVPNSVIWNRAKVVYADIDDSYNLNVASIQKVFSKKTKAVIVQHTFGIPAEIDAIVSWAHKQGIIVIEDCAHALGATYQGKALGAWGDAAFFSFGRDKVVSSVFGGVALIHDRAQKNIDIATVATRLHTSHTNLPQARRYWIFQQVFHPVAFAFVLPFYQSGIGKLLLVLFQKLGWLSFPVYPEEKSGIQPKDFPADFPVVLAKLALHQLQKLERYNTCRQDRALEYRRLLKDRKDLVLPPAIDGAIWLRFPVLVTNPQSLIKQVKQQGILLGNWYQSVIDPPGVDKKGIGYHQECTVAESMATQVVNLPTRITKTAAEDVIKRVIEYLELEKS